MKTITVAVPKGGTGKTATAGALLQAAAYTGQSVLGVDMDPQSSLTIWSDADPTLPGAFEVLEEGQAVSDVVQHCDQGLDLLAGSADLTALTSRSASATRLKEALKKVARRYSLCVIDTPPGLGEAMNNALFAADLLLVPVEADTDSLQALYQMADLADQVKQSGHKLKQTGSVVTRYDGRPKANRYLLQLIQEKGAEVGVPCLGVIRQGVAVREARDFQQSLFEYARKSKPAEDYMELFRTVTG